MTASITGTAANLDQITTGASDKISITIDSGSHAAALLTSIGGKTALTVNANNVDTLTGTLSEINVVLTADGNGTILIDDDFNATVSDTTIEASALTALSTLTEGVITASATTITGTDTEIQNILADSTGISIEANVNFDLDDTDVSSQSILASIASATNGSVIAANITDTDTAINSLALNNSSILENATGTITANGTFVGEFINMINVADKADLTINAGSGADTIISGGGDDIIYGGRGDDIIKAANGNDIIAISDIETNGIDKLYSFRSNGNAADVKDAEGNDAGRDVIQFSAADLQAVSGFTNYTGSGTKVTIDAGIYAEFLVNQDADELGATFTYNTTTGFLTYDADGSGSNSSNTTVVQIFGDDDESVVLSDILSADLSFTGGIA